VSRRRLLLLGATGRLGSALRDGALEGWDVDAPARRELNLRGLAMGDTAGLDGRLGGEGPTVVLNAAALAGVDACEVDREGARAVNATGPAALAEACARVGVPLVHVSTDYVFGDPSVSGAGPYPEDAAPCPAQFYGQTKAEGEARVLRAGNRAHVVRLSWIYGPTSRAFLDHVLGQVDGSGQPVSVFSAQQSRPTLAPSAAAWLIALCDHLAGGGTAPSILHPVGGPSASRSQWARAILDARGYEGLALVDQPMRVPGFEAAAVRPLDSRLDGEATTHWATDVGLPRLVDWRECPAPA